MEEYERGKQECGIGNYPTGTPEYIYKNPITRQPLIDPRRATREEWNPHFVKQAGIGITPSEPQRM
jgi:hypothetical protein